MLLNELPPDRIVNRRSKGSKYPQESLRFSNDHDQYSDTNPLLLEFSSKIRFFTGVQNRLARSLRIVARTLQINGGAGVRTLRRLNESLDRGKL